MADADFWKQRYQHSWSKAEQRERAIQERILQEAGKQVEFVGLGAGSDEYLSGSAASQGYERGGADLHIVGTNVYLEVTGPQTKSVSLSEPLWIRPDKVTNARNHFPKYDTWVIHWLERDGTVRVIHLNERFFELVDNGTFPITRQTIRGTTETYFTISASHPCVQLWSVLIQRLKML